jgi:hypothetical protein
MRSLSLVTIALLSLLASTAAPAVASGPAIATFHAQFVAGSAHVDVDPAGDQAAGVADCSHPASNGPNLGGACFDLFSFPPGSEVRVTLQSDQGGDVSLFAGFDVDHDGCVGCSRADVAWEGLTTLSASTLPAPGPAPFEVFVRAVSLEGSGGLGAPGVGAPQAFVGFTGTVTVEVFAPGTGPCQAEGQCSGEPFQPGPTPYPYEGF